MDLKFDEVVNLLHVSKQTLDSWIDKKDIPYYTISGKKRFNRQELEEWLLESVVNEKDLAFGENEDGGSTWSKYCLYRAIHKGCIISSVQATTKEEVIKDVMAKAQDTLKINGEMIAEMLIERENLMSTALGESIAVPHTRDFLLHDYTDAAVVAYLDEPMDWGAIDGSKTDILIFLFACDDKRHLNLLAKTAHLTANKDVRALLKTKPSKEKLLDTILEFEKNLTAKPALA